MGRLSEDEFIEIVFVPFLEDFFSMTRMRSTYRGWQDAVFVPFLEDFFSMYRKVTTMPIDEK